MIEHMEKYSRQNNIMFIEEKFLLPPQKKSSISAASEKLGKTCIQLWRYRI
jgi:hypothetical protein